MAISAQQYIKDLGALRAGMVDSMRQNNAWEGFKRTLSDLYPDEAHFIYELLQNAEDAQATSVEFNLTSDLLTFIHDGKRLFKNEDVESITNIGHSTKSDDLNQIGKFGVGFKAVFAYTSTPQIYSGDFSFEIRDLFVPYWRPENLATTGQTQFDFPFNGPKPPQKCAAEVSAWLRQVKDNVLLFLRSVRSIRWTTQENRWTQIERHERANNIVEIQYSSSDTTHRPHSHWLRFIEPIDPGSPLYVAAAFELKPADADAQPLLDQQSFQGTIVPTKGQLSIYFPAEKEKTGLHFHLHGPYASTVARDSIPASHPGNQQLLRKTAEVLANSMSKVKSLQLLTSDFLEVLPNASDDLPPFYQPILEALVTAFKNQALVPADRGGHAPASSLLKGPARIRDVIGNEDLAILSGAPTSRWVAGVMESHRADKFLAALGIRDWSWSDLDMAMLRKFGADSAEAKAARWLATKDDEWLQAFYALLKQMLEEQGRYDSTCGGWQTNTERLRIQEWHIVRLHNGQHVPGCGVFFPDEGGGAGEFPIVKPSLLVGKRPKQVEAARQFLIALGVRAVEERDRIMRVLDRHYGPTALSVAWEAHLDHLRWFTLWWHNHSQDTTPFRDHAFFFGERDHRLKAADAFLDTPLVATGLGALFNPPIPGLGRRSPLKPDYAKAGIPKLLAFAQSCGVMACLSFTKTTSRNNPYYGELHRDGGRRTQYETDEDYTIDHLDALLASKNLGASALLWRTMSAAEPAYLQARYCANYQAAYRSAPSQLVCSLTRAAWVPDKAGRFLKPGDVRREDLPDGFACDDRNGWLTAIGFESSLRKESAATQERRKVAASLGIPSEAVDLLEQLPEVARKEALTLFLDELRRRKQQAQRPGTTPIAFSELVTASLNRSVNQAPPSALDHSSLLADPDRRRQLTGSEIEQARSNEPDSADRSRIAARKVWESKDATVRTFLAEQYNGRCQICGATFIKRDGLNYFEARYLVPHSTQGAAWLDRPGNVLCLCATCCAKLQHGSIESPENVIAQIRALKLGAEHRSQPLEVHINLCHETVAIRFTARHLLDLQEIIASETPTPALPPAAAAAQAPQAPSHSIVITEILQPVPIPASALLSAAPVALTTPADSGLVQRPFCPAADRRDRLDHHIAMAHASEPPVAIASAPAEPIESFVKHSNFPRCLEGKRITYKNIIGLVTSVSDGRITIEPDSGPVVTYSAEFIKMMLRRT